MNREMKWLQMGLLLLTVAVAGCGQSPRSDSEVIKSANPSNIYRLTNLYSAFADRSRGVGPKDEKQFREFIATFGQDRLQRMGVDPASLDALFSSERDSQPFEVRYRQKKPDRRGQGQDGASGVSEVAVVLEASGVNGVRQVGFLGTRAVKNLDGSEIEKIK